MNVPDFEALRAERNAKNAAWVEKMRAEGWEVGQCSLRHDDACYCACPDGPCEHDFQGWREFEGGGETFCQRCGMGSMSHSLHTSG